MWSFPVIIYMFDLQLFRIQVEGVITLSDVQHHKKLFFLQTDPSFLVWTAEDPQRIPLPDPHVYPWTWGRPINALSKHRSACGLDHGLGIFM